MWVHKEGSQPEHKAIEHSEIRRTLSGAIADQELMFEQERFSCDLARAARAEEFRRQAQPFLARLTARSQKVSAAGDCRAFGRNRRIPIGTSAAAFPTRAKRPAAMSSATRLSGDQHIPRPSRA